MTFGRVAMPLGRVAVAKTLIFWAKRPFATGFGGLVVVKKRQLPPFQSQFSVATSDKTSATSP
jgi:hypothetical protein